MLLYEELRGQVTSTKEQLDDLGVALGLDKVDEELERLQAVTAEPDFWNDMKNSQSILKQISYLKNKKEGYAALRTQYDDGHAPGGPGSRGALPGPVGDRKTLHPPQR